MGGNGQRKKIGDELYIKTTETNDYTRFIDSGVIRNDVFITNYRNVDT